MIPQVLNNFNVYLGDGGTRLIGTANVELPEIKQLTVEVSQAGMGGPINQPIIGQTEAMQVTINGDVATREQLRQATPDRQMITVRGAVQVWNERTGRDEIQNLTVVMRGCNSSVKIGTAERGSKMSPGLTYELDYIKVILNNEDLIEHDKLANIYRVGGVDYSAAVRNAI